MDGLSKGGEKKELSKKEKAALKKIEKENKKKEKERLKQEKELKKQQEKEAKKNKGKTPTTTPSTSGIGSPPVSPGGNVPPTAKPPPDLKKTGSNSALTTSNGHMTPPPLKKGPSSGSLPTVEKGNDDPSLPGLLGNKVKRRRPRKFKEKEFNQVLESIRSGAFTGACLDLNNRFLDKYAAADLAKVLSTNSTVTDLNLSNNEIGDDGVVPLSRMLEKNKTIRILDVQFNGLTRKGTKHLLTCLNNNVFITELYMDEKEVNLGDMFVNTDTALEAIGADVREKIERLVQSNKNFQLLLEGKSNSLELPNRSQSYVNTHILERFPDLGNIDLRKNKLRFIPEEIGLLKRLEQLRLSDNRIEKLPNQIGELVSLQILDLSNNCLSELPLSLTTLPRLKHLYLQSNKFNDLPRFSLGSMKSLVTLDIRGNPLAQMSCMGSSFMDVVEQGGRETLSFLRENNKGMAEVYRMKMMFVGNGNVGKTTLLHHLIKQKKILPAGGHVSSVAASAAKEGSGSMGTKPVGSQIRTPKVPKTLENVATDGIDIHKWNYKHPGKSYVTKPGAELIDEDDLKEKYINFSCWDFAGQEVYYATHSFFLSQRAIYLLVFNLLEPEENNQIEYWLQSINARTEGSPIIMVGTHSEDKRCTQEYITLYFSKIMEKYGQRFKNHIVSMHAISNVEKNSGIPELKDKIVRVALNQDFMPDRIALSFLALEEKLMGAQQTLNPPTLTFDDYKSMAVDCNISEENVLLATKFLNDLGSLVYFSDKDEGLNDLVVVDPQWITKTFATVVSLKYGFIRDGIMKISDLPFIWAPPNYPPALHPKLIAMLEKLGIISRLKHEGDDKILIPCLLPENPPPANVMDDVWPQFEEDSAQAGRVYSFEFVPLGFFSRLIVRFLVSHSYDPLVYWKKGIILKKDNETIKLTMHKDGKIKNLPMTMELWVRGKSPGKHLVDLVDNIDTLVDDWLRVKFERSVPCVHCIKEGSQDPYLFPLKVVEQSFADNLQSVKCRGITEVSIASIAPDVAMSEYQGSVVKLSEIQKGKMIGEGGFAKVYKAIWKGKVIALKELTLDSSSTTDAIGFEFEDATDPLAVFAEFRKEVSLMSDMKHPNIVGLLGLCMDPFCMLLEFCGLGCLYDYIHNEKCILNWPVVVKVADDIAKGMHFMHTYTPPLIHRDLKSPNVLLSVEPDETGTPMIVAKVADFGLSRKLMLAGQLNLKVVDNPVWLAPEMMRKEDYDEKVDIYSYGVILWELVDRGDFLGNITFLSAIEDAVLKGERPIIPQACIEKFPELAQLIRRCWDNSPKERPDFNHCMQVIKGLRERRLPTVPDKMPPWKLEVAAPESLKAEQEAAAASKRMQPAAQPQLSDRTTTSVPITKHRQPPKTTQSAITGMPPSLVEDDNEPRASPEVLAIVHGGDRTTKTLLPFARGRGGPVRGKPGPPAGGPRAPQPRPHAGTAPASGQQPSEVRDRSASWQRGLKSDLRLMDREDVQISNFDRTLDRNTGSAITRMLAFGDRVWTSTASGKVFIWDTKSGTVVKEVTMHKEGILAMLLVLQKEVWTSSSDGTLKIWNYEGEEVGEIPTKAICYCLLEDPNTHFVWIGCNMMNAPKKQPPEYGAVQVWDPSARRHKKTWRVEPFALPGTVNAVSPIPRCMLYHMNHVFVGAGHRILCYEPQTFASQGYMEDHTGELNSLISLGDEIWSAAKDKLVKVWNPKENGSDCLATMEGHVGEVMDLCIDGAGHIWSCGWDKKIFVWNAGEVKQFISFLPTQHSKSVSCLLMTSFNEGGKQVRKIWSASIDGTIGLWRLESFIKIY